MVAFPRLQAFSIAVNSRVLFDGMMLYFEWETMNDLEFSKNLYNLWVDLVDRTNDKDLFITEREGVPQSVFSYNYCCVFLEDGWFRGGLGSRQLGHILEYVQDRDDDVG
ncbi:hypothetical protein Tco_0246098 [Tanacetum coccineum]